MEYVQYLLNFFVLPVQTQDIDVEDKAKYTKQNLFVSLK